MVNKKLKGTVEIELKSKQFQDEAKKVGTTLKGLETYIKNTDKVLRGLGSAWQEAYKHMNTFASISAKIQKTNYNNLRSSTDAIAKSTRDLGTAGTGTARKIGGLGSASNTTAQHMGGLNSTTTKLNAALNKQGQTFQAVQKSTAQYGTSADQTGKKTERLSLFVNQSEKSMKVMTSTVAKTSDGYKRYGVVNDGLIQKLEKMDIKMDKASQAILDMSKSTQQANTSTKNLGAGLTATTQKIDKIGASSQKTSQQFSALGINGQQVGGSIQSVGSLSGVTTQKIDQMGMEIQQTTQQFGGLGGASQQMGSRLQGVGGAAGGTTQKIDKMGMETQQTIQQFKSLGAATQKTTGSIRAVGTTAEFTKGKLDAMGNTAQKSTQKIKSLGGASQQATTGMQSLGNNADKSSTALGGMSTATQSSTTNTLLLGQSIAGTAGAITGISDTAFGFQEKIIALDKSKFGLVETTEDLKRAEEDYATILDEGIITGRELERVEKDLSLLRTKHKIETEEVRGEEEALNAEYVTFAVNIGNAGLQMATMIPTLKEMGIFTKIASLENTKLGIASKKVMGSMYAQAGATRTATTATKGLTAAAKGFLFSPVGIALMALGGLWLAWETNALGFRDAVHSVIDAFQTLGGWIVDMFVPALNAVSWVLRAIGIDVPKLGDKIKGLSNDISGNIDQWQELEKAERAAGAEAEEYAETTTEAFAETTNTVKTAYKEMTSYSELSFDRQTQALEDALQYAQEQYVQHMAKLKKEQSLLSDKTDVESKRRLQIINEEIEGTKEEYHLATTVIQTEIDKVTSYTESAMQELGMIAKETTQTTVQFYDEMTTEIKEEYDDLNSYSKMSFNSQLEALRTSLDKTTEFYVQHIARLKKEQADLTQKTDQESKLRLQIVNDELEATLQSYHNTVDGIQGEMDKVAGYTESAMQDMGLSVQEVTDDISDDMNEMGDEVIDTTHDMDDAFADMTDNMGDNFANMTDDIIKELERVQTEAEKTYADIHKKDWDKVFDHQENAAELGLSGVSTTGAISTPLEGWADAHKRIEEIQSELRYILTDNWKYDLLQQKAGAAEGVMTTPHTKNEDEVNKRLSEYVEKTSDWIYTLQNIGSADKILTEVYQTKMVKDQHGNQTQVNSGDNIWDVYDGKMHKEGFVRLEDVRDIINMDDLKAYTDTIRDDTTTGNKSYLAEAMLLLGEEGGSNNVQYSNMQELIKRFVDQGKVDAKIAEEQNKITEEGLERIRELMAELNQEMADGIVGSYEKGFGGDEIYRSDAGNYQFSRVIEELGANAGSLLKGLTIGKTQDGEIGDLTGISYTSDDGWFNKITGESFSSFMEAQRAALENSTAYQMAQVHNIIQPLIDKANIEREAAGQDQITYFETFNELTNFLKGMNALDGITASTLSDLHEQLIAKENEETKEEEIIEATEGQTDAIVDGAEQAKSIGDTTIENIQKQLELSGTSNELSQEQMVLNEKQNELTTQQNELTQKILSLDEGDTVKMAELVSIMDEIKEQQELLELQQELLEKQNEMTGIQQEQNELTTHQNDLVDLQNSLTAKQKELTEKQNELSEELKGLTEHDTERAEEIARESDAISQQQIIVTEDQKKISELQQELLERQNELITDYTETSQELGDLASEYAEEQIELAKEQNEILLKAQQEQEQESSSSGGSGGGANPVHDGGNSDGNNELVGIPDQGGNNDGNNNNDNAVLTELQQEQNELTTQQNDISQQQNELTQKQIEYQVIEQELIDKQVALGRELKELTSEDTQRAQEIARESDAIRVEQKEVTGKIYEIDRLLKALNEEQNELTTRQNELIKLQILQAETREEYLALQNDLAAQILELSEELKGLTIHDTERAEEIGRRIEELTQDQTDLANANTHFIYGQNQDIAQQQNELTQADTDQSQTNADTAHQDSQEQIVLTGEGNNTAQQQLDQEIQLNEIMQEGNTTLDLIKDYNFGIESNTSITNEILTKIGKYLNRLVGLGIKNNSNQQSILSQQSQSSHNKQLL